MSPVRVIGADGSQVGVVETPQAIRMAEELGLDLVEISPDTRPPVCKIMDYGKFKYEQSKQTKNKGAKASELKEVRLGRSVKIDPHDVDIRVKQARRFLMDGHKVMITQKFKGREMAHRELGINRLREIRDKLSDIAKCETEPRWMGPQASIIMAPDKHKAEAAKRAEQKAKKAEEKAEQRAERRMEDEAARLAAGTDAPAPATTLAPAPQPAADHTPEPAPAQPH